MYVDSNYTVVSNLSINSCSTLPIFIDNGMHVKNALIFERSRLKLHAGVLLVRHPSHCLKTCIARIFSGL